VRKLDAVVPTQRNGTTERVMLKVNDVVS
jgi:hypothetical protein